MSGPTGAERYFQARLEDPDYRAAYEHARHRIDQVDRMIRLLDERRAELGLTKAELGRRARIPPEAVRRIFSAERPNPTLQTLASIAEALDLDLLPTARRASASRERSDAPGTRRRTA